MIEVLFDGKNNVTNEMVIEKMRYFENKAKEASGYLQTDKKLSLEIAKELRQELKGEYKSNDLLRIRKIYAEHELFSAFYVPAVSNAYVKTTGALSYKNLNSFLYDVSSYMNQYIPRKYK